MIPKHCIIQKHNLWSGVKEISQNNVKTITRAAITIVSILLLGGGGYLYYLNNFMNSRVSTKVSNDPKPLSFANDVKQSTGAQNGQPSAVYVISGLNKQDGDVFSMPDTIKFKISPDVDEARATLATSEGQILSENTTQGSSMERTVYMNGRPGGGATGILKIEGLAKGSVVITKEIRVVF